LGQLSSNLDLRLNPPPGAGFTYDASYICRYERIVQNGTHRGYSQMWSIYLKTRCEAAWMREVKTHQVQSWLNEIGREHATSTTTLKRVKNFLSGIFQYAAQQGYFDGASPVKLAEIPAFALNASGVTQNAI
jgi:hypothetical protein